MQQRRRSSQHSHAHAFDERQLHCLVSGHVAPNGQHDCLQQQQQREGAEKEECVSPILLCHSSLRLTPCECIAVCLPASMFCCEEKGSESVRVASEEGKREER